MRCLFTFVTKIRIYNHKISSVAQTVRNMLMLTKVFPSESYCQGSTAAGSSRVLWDSSVFAIRILKVN